MVGVGGVADVDGRAERLPLGVVDRRENVVGIVPDQRVIAVGQRRHARPRCIGRDDLGRRHLLTLPVVDRRVNIAAAGDRTAPCQRKAAGRQRGDLLLFLHVSAGRADIAGRCNELALGVIDGEIGIADIAADGRCGGPRQCDIAVRQVGGACARPGLSHGIVDAGAVGNVDHSADRLALRVVNSEEDIVAVRRIEAVPRDGIAAARKRRHDGTVILETSYCC